MTHFGSYLTLIKGQIRSPLATHIYHYWADLDHIVQSPIWGLGPYGPSLNRGKFPIFGLLRSPNMGPRIGPNECLGPFEGSNTQQALSV